MEEHVSMKIINPNAAGIDIGSRSHWVAIGGYFGSNSANHFGVIVPAISVQIVPL